MAEREYVLGTHDEEVERLGLQHRVWRQRMTNAWNLAGITAGQKILDVGAGPGYATLDLAQIVGSEGRVVACEISEKFVRHGLDRLAANNVSNVTYQALDLVTDEIGVQNFDAAWCRWVLSFVSDPALVVEKVAKALRVGGKFVIHEYLDYSTWSCLPVRPAQKVFVELTMKHWREAGGEPNIGYQLAGHLKAAGFRIVRAEPILFRIKPTDYAWQWPIAWIKSSTKKLVEHNLMTEQEALVLQNEFDEMEIDPESVMMSPSVIEFIAERV